MYNAVIKNKSPTSFKKRWLERNMPGKVRDYEILFSTGLVQISGLLSVSRNRKQYVHNIYIYM